MIQHILIIVVGPALAGIGLVLSLWILRQSSGLRGLPGCGAGSGCDAVTHSRWSRWCGVPVAAPAAVLYLALAGGFLFLGLSPRGRWAGMVGVAMFPAAPLLAAAAVWFIGLQWLAIRRVCLYCLLLHAVGLGIAGSVLGEPTITGSAGVVGWIVAGAGILGLVLGQVFVEPRMYRVAVASGQWPVASGKGSVAGDPLSVVGMDVGARSVLGPGAKHDKPRARRSGAPDESRANGKTFAAASVGCSGDTVTGADHIRGSAALRRRLDATHNEALNSPSGPVSECVDTNPFASRRVVALNGKVSLEGGKWPTLGSARAASTLVYLFDYTCANCRTLHRVLLEAMREDGEAFAVMLVPVPHDPRCNPAIARLQPEHANACAYARLALTLWAGDWSQYAAFDEFLFAGGQPPALGLARARAAAMLGREVFDPTVPDADVDPVIREGIELYKSVGPERTPTVLMPVGFFTGRVGSTAELWKILAKGTVSRVAKQVVGSSGGGVVG